MYKYDTHIHTSQASACASGTGKEIARAYYDKGYTGIFITDHFFNGNTSIEKKLSWKDRVNCFCSGYEDAKEEGDKIGLDVFFGFEYAVEGADFLVYNLDKQWLLEHENIDRLNPVNAFNIIRSDGGFVVQAHPFRERYYISHIKLCPDWIDAVEVHNGSHGKNSEFDKRARWFADSYGLPVTAGSDTHSPHKIFESGILTEDKINSSKDYTKFVLDGKILLFGD